MFLLVSIHVALGIALVLLEGDKKHYIYLPMFACLGGFLVYAIILLTIINHDWKQYVSVRS